MTEQDDMCLRYAKCYHRVGRLYMQGQRGHTVQKSLKSGKLTSLLTTYHSSSSAFMTSNTPGGAKKHCQNTEPYLSLCNYGKRCLQGGCILNCFILAVVPTFCCSATLLLVMFFYYLWCNGTQGWHGLHVEETSNIAELTQIHSAICANLLTRI